MKRALLDALDRSLLLALFAGGYVFAAVMLVASTWLALSGLGALGETGWAFARERPVVVWVFCFCLLALAPLGWFFSRDVVPPIERARYAARLAREVVKTQEDDGSMWDFYFNTYGPAYGTAFGVMTLTRTLPER